MKARLLTILILTLFFQAVGQKILLPNLSLKPDSFLLGKTIFATLVYKHDPNQEVVFPDSAYDYSPFEYINKNISPTYTIGDSLSVDSVVYELACFEMEQKLRLSLPVFIIQGQDTSKLYSNDAYIGYKPLITSITLADTLKVNTKFWDMQYAINYPYILIGISSLLILGLIVFLFFRKKIIAQFQLYFAKRDYDRFFTEFNRLESIYISQKSTKQLEAMLNLWKKYLEKIDSIPYTTLTTKEISQIMQYNQLTSSLQNFDRAIYGGLVKEDMSNSIGVLREISLQKFNHKTKELRRV